MTVSLWRNWHLRIGGPVRLPMIGAAREELQNGWIIRVSLWPRRVGIYFLCWREPFR